MESIDSSAKKAQELIDKETAQDPDITKILSIVREFIETHRVMCYGGTAINDLLPERDRFYNPKKDVPDYDFFSETPQIHGTMLVDQILKEGYENVELKPGVHLGTFKVFANFTGVADISHLDKNIFQKLWKESITRNKIHYVPPNFLRMSMYLELSRPKGDVSRWTKVYKRLQLLNKEYPVKCTSHSKDEPNYLDNDQKAELQELLIKEEGVLLGFNAAMLQSSNTKWELPVDLIVVPDKRKSLVDKIKRFFKTSHLKNYPAYEELFPAHTDILDNKLLVRVYEADACHSYHKATSGLMIASIPTILQFIFATLYAPKHFSNNLTEDRYICNAQHLMDLKETHKYKNLTPITCIGKQKQLTDLRQERSEIYEKYSANRSSAKFIEYFFMYSPSKLTKTQRRKTRNMLKKTLRKI
jgi:hypothetical protein